MRTNTKNWEERKKIIKFYEVMKRNRNKRIQKVFNKFVDSIKYVGRFFMILIGWFVHIFLSVMVGYASEPIIYYLNKPLGLGYAHFASYALTGLTLLLLRGNKK